MAQRQGSGHVQDGEEPTAPERECEGDCGDGDRNRGGYKGEKRNAWERYDERVELRDSEKETHQDRNRKDRNKRRLTNNKKIVRLLEYKTEK